MIESIGFVATTQLAYHILKGTADIYTINNDSTSRDLFEISKSSKIKLEIEVTKDRMMGRYKKWNEHTVTSPSGRHLGHFHGLFHPFRYELEDLEDKVDLEDTEELIINIYIMLL